MTKEKKRSGGLFGLFKKKTPKEDKKEKSNSTAYNPNDPNDSFAELNSLIPSPKLTYTAPEPKQEPRPEPTSLKSATPKEPAANGVSQNGEKKPSKKVARRRTDRHKRGAGHRKARAAPPPPEERGVDVELVVSSKKTAENQVVHEEARVETVVQEKPLSIVEELKIETSAVEIKFDLAEPEMTPKSNSEARLVETEVIHYSPHGTVREPSRSPEPPKPDMPSVERQSNIILNDTMKRRSIPVSYYDGRPRQPAPPPPSSPMTTTAPPHTRMSSLDTTKDKKPPTMMARPSSMSVLSSVPKLDAPPKPVRVAQTKEERYLQERFDALMERYNLWDSLRDDPTKKAEAKEMLKQLTRDNKEVTLLAQKIAPDISVSPSLRPMMQKKRLTITPETYTPRITNSTSVRAPLTISAFHSPNSSSPSPNSSSSPSTSRSITPKNASSSPSISPAASIESADSGLGRSKRSDYAIPEFKRLSTLDENSNLTAKKEEKRKEKPSRPADSDSEKQRAIDRINQEAREFLRKEQELRRPAPEPPKPEPEVKRLPSPAVPPPPVPSSPVPKLPHTGSTLRDKEKDQKPSIYTAPSQELKIYAVSTVKPTTATYVHVRNRSEEKPAMPEIRREKEVSSTIRKIASTPRLGSSVAIYSSSSSRAAPTLSTIKQGSAAVDSSLPPTRSTPSLGTIRQSSATVPSTPKLSAASPTVGTVRLGSNAVPSSPAPARTSPSAGTARLPSTPTEAPWNVPKNTATTVSVPLPASAAEVAPWNVPKSNSKAPKLDSPTISKAPKLDSPSSKSTSDWKNSRAAAQKSESKPEQTRPTKETVTIVPVKLSNRSKSEDVPQKKFTPPSRPMELSIDAPPPKPSRDIRNVISTAAKAKPAVTPLENVESPKLEKAETPKLPPAVDTKKPAQQSPPQSAVSCQIKNVISTAATEVKKPPKKIIEAPVVVDEPKPRQPMSMASALEAAGGFPTLRKVNKPVERSGISLGRVLDMPPSTSSTPPPAPPPPPPMYFNTPPPAPPPPPPMFAQSPTIMRPTSMPPAAPPPPPLGFISSQQLNDQRVRLKPATPVIQTSGSPLDLRDSLMAEIRNAGGARGLRKVAAAS